MQAPRLELGSGESQSPILPGKLRLPIVNRVRGRPCSRHGGGHGGYPTVPTQRQRSASIIIACYHCHIRKPPRVPGWPLRMSVVEY